MVCVYFRFLSAQKATTPTAAITATAIIASSVVPKANAAAGSSVSIDCAGDWLSVIKMAVSEYDR